MCLGTAAFPGGCSSEALEHASQLASLGGPYAAGLTVTGHTGHSRATGFVSALCAVTLAIYAFQNKTYVLRPD